MNHDSLVLSIDSLRISPYAMSCFVALEEKGLPYTLREVNLQAKEHQLPGYRARTGRVPSLAHGDYVLAESSAIAEYVAETFPHPRYPRLFPQDLKQRGIARELMAWLRSDLMPIREERPTHSMFFDRIATPLSKAAEAAKARLIDAVQPLIDGTSLFESWCLADAELSIMLQRFIINGDALPMALSTYADANWQRPSVQKWLSLPRPPFKA